MQASHALWSGHHKSCFFRTTPMPLPFNFDLQAFERPRIVHIAETALATEPRSITTVRNPRSAGGSHDFSSEGDYWWPDPDHPGAPYIERDGMTNPDNFVAQIGRASCRERV